jgi:hypothetical protein
MARLVDDRRSMRRRRREDRRSQLLKIEPESGRRGRLSGGSLRRMTVSVGRVGIGRSKECGG